MHLALNFQRVDPSRGGAETYVADLCRALAQGGHRVDLYAESWADDCLPREVNVVPVGGPGRTKLERIWNFADNSEQAMRQGGHDCSVGFINTWAHDVIIPQGGVQEGSLRANAARFGTAIHGQAYRLMKAANPKFWVHRAIEQRQYDHERTARYVAVSQMVRRHLRGVPPGPPAAHPRRAQRDRCPTRSMSPSPVRVRCAFRNRLGFEPGDLVGLFVGPQLRAQGSASADQRPSAGALGKIPRAARSTCWSAAAATPRPYIRLANRLGLRDHVHFLGFYPDIRDAYWSSDFFVQPTYYDPCSLVVLEALACGLPVITTEQNGAGELMAQGKQGFILSSPDAESELIDALNKMTDDKARRAMSAEARRLGRQQTFDVHVERLLAVFEEAARGKKGRVPHSGKWSAKAAFGPHAGRSKRSVDV